MPDFAKVANAVQVSDEVAAGPEAASEGDAEESGIPAGVRERVPVSSLAPPPSAVLNPIVESDLEGYEPSDAGMEVDVLAPQSE